MTEIEAELRISLEALRPILGQVLVQAQGKTKELAGMLAALVDDLVEQLDMEETSVDLQAPSPVELEIASLEQARRDYMRNHGQQS